VLAVIFQAGLAIAAKNGKGKTGYMSFGTSLKAEGGV
jgi:hypothetical protein